MKFLLRHRKCRRALLAYVAFDALYWWKLKPIVRADLKVAHA